MEAKAKKTVRLYGCGGGGINMAYALEALRKREQVGHALLDIAYVDASRSNVRDNIPEDAIYLIDGVDGRGKVRSENPEIVAERVKEIIQKFKPADLNIVVSTLAGGTGSVAAPLIAKELLLREAPTVVVGIGDTSTIKDTENTLRTIQTYEHIAKTTNVPVVMQYIGNSRENTRDVVNRMVGALVVSLTALFSGENRELDSRDLFNWLRFSNPNVTSFGAQLASLRVINETEGLFKDLAGNVISVASLLKEGQHYELPVRPEYATYGFLSNEVDNAFTQNAPHHFVISDEGIAEVTAKLKAILAETKEAQDARPKRRSILDQDVTVDNSGLIF